MDEVTGMLQRMRTLSQQASNGSRNNSDDRDALQQEYAQLSTKLIVSLPILHLSGTNLLDSELSWRIPSGC